MTIITRFLGLLLGGALGLVGSPVLALWYTYKSTAPRGWNLGFVFSCITFVPRLFFNFIRFAGAGLVGGMIHGSRAGFISGLMWLFRLGYFIHKNPELGLWNSVLKALNMDRKLPEDTSDYIEEGDTKASKFHLARLTERAPGSTLSLVSASQEPERKPEPAASEPDENALVLTRDISIFTENDFKALAVTLELNEFNALSIRACQLHAASPENLRNLMDCINKSSRIKVLYLNEAKIGQMSTEQVTALSGELAKNEALTDLFLFDNELTTKHFEVLMSAIAQTKITTLDIGNNALHTFAPEDLIGYLSPLRGRLNLIHLDNNKLGRWPRVALIKLILSLQVKRQVNLDQNELQGDPGAWSNDNIIEFVQRFHSLPELKLFTNSNNGFSEAQRAVFNQFTDPMVDTRLQAFCSGRRAAITTWEQTRINGELILTQKIARPPVYLAFFRGIIIPGVLKRIEEYLPKRSEF